MSGEATLILVLVAGAVYFGIIMTMLIKFTANTEDDDDD
jgi:hypothetical protein